MMNYLAHAFLSNNDKHLLVGNFIADHLRGNDFSAYPEEIIKGIYLHRKIDAFTDAHSAFKNSKRVFYKGFEKYSGILVDIYFDHLLAKDFENFSREPLNTFSKKVYDIYSQHSDLLPKSGSGFLEYVIKNNIYHSYASQQGIETVLYHLSHRINHGIRMDESIHLFRDNEKFLEANFNQLFNDAIKEFIGK
jgi:acyl carrier protein phosphodiesterase